MALAATPSINQQLKLSPQSPRYAVFWFRTLAAIIDSVLCQVAVSFVGLPHLIALAASLAGSPVTEVEAAGATWSSIVGVLVQWLWFTVAESSEWQASLGKKLLGLKVTTKTGERIGFGKANVRYWSKLLSALLFFIGYFMIAFTKKKQGLHDIMAGMLVVESDE